MNKKLVFLFSTNLSSKPYDAWSKDTYNFIKIIGEKYQIDINGYTNETNLENLKTSFKNNKNLISGRILIKKSFSEIIKIPLLRNINISQLFDLSSKLAITKPKILFVSPFHECIFQSLLWCNENLVCYVADSPSYQMGRLSKLKKNNKFKLIKHKLSSYVYFLLEKFLTFKGVKFIVVSDDSYDYYIRKNFKKNQIIKFSPGFSEKVELSKKVIKDNKITFLRPNSKGQVFVKEIASMIKKNNIDLDIQVAGITKFENSVKKELDELDVKFISFVDSYDDLLLTSKAVIITDLDGIGFCNRAAYCLFIGALLLSTQNGVRGTGAKDKKHYLKFKNSQDLFKLIREINQKVNPYNSISSKALIYGEKFNYQNLKKRTFSLFED